MTNEQVTAHLTRAEELVRKHTAFRSLADLCVATLTGYVPSIYGINPRRKETKEKAELVKLLREMNVKVYDGQVK